MALADLPSSWRRRAQELERFAPAAAEAFRVAAAELDEAVCAAEEALLPPAEATKVSGLSERTLRERKQKGQLKDHGTPGRPLYRRGDLPQRVKGSPNGFDPSAHVAAITGSSS